MARLPLAIAIVPAVNVSDWHILSGDSPITRYVVVDVTNTTDTDAELTYGDGRTIWVQPREICRFLIIIILSSINCILRVPLLCPCCTEIQSSAFVAAAQQASHMMQMQEIERLRRKLEKHVSKHLDIRWTIPALKVVSVKNRSIIINIARKIRFSNSIRIYQFLPRVSFKC